MANAKGVKIVTTFTMKKVTGGWSRYGGGRRGLIKSENENEWYCQSCAMGHGNEDSPYMFEFSPGEFIRICNKCLWLAKVNHALDFLALKELVNRAKE
jgi:hypothetical protein